MMICTIHSRTHQVDRTGIHSDIFLIRMLFMNRLCHKCTIRSHHKTTHFCIDCNIIHTGFSQYLIIYLMHAFSDHADIVWFFIRCIRNSDTAGKIDKANMCTCFFLQLYCQFKQLLCQYRIILICYCVAGKECMNTKVLNTLFLQNTESFK